MLENTVALLSGELPSTYPKDQLQFFFAFARGKQYRRSPPFKIQKNVLYRYTGQNGWKPIAIRSINQFGYQVVIKMLTQIRNYDLNHDLGFILALSKLGWEPINAGMWGLPQQSTRR